MAEWQHSRLPLLRPGFGFPARPQVGKLVVACRWLAVYSIEPWPTVCTGFLCPSNYPSWYDLYSVESDVKPQINKYNLYLYSYIYDRVAKGRADRGYQCLGSKMFLVLSDYSPYVTASFSIKVSEKRCGYFHPEIHDTSEYYPPCALAEFPTIYPATYKLYFIDPFYKEDRYFSFVFSMMGNCVQQCFNVSVFIIKCTKGLLYGPVTLLRLNVSCDIQAIFHRPILQGSECIHNPLY